MRYHILLDSVLPQFLALVTMTLSHGLVTIRWNFRHSHRSPHLHRQRSVASLYGYFVFCGDLEKFSRELYGDCVA